MNDLQAFKKWYHDKSNQPPLFSFYFLSREIKNRHIHKHIHVGILLKNNIYFRLACQDSGY